MSSTSAKRLSVKAICLSLVTFTVVAVTAGVAWAAFTDNIYPTQYVTAPCRDESSPDGKVTCLTDNSALTYFTVGSGGNALEPNDRNVVAGVMNNIFNPTDLSVSRHTTPVYSGSSETDIIYEETGSGVPSSADGVTFCNDAATDLRCDQQYVRIREGGYYVQGLTCHETGHAVGLLHGSNATPLTDNRNEALGCMETPTSNEETLQSNNIDNINGTY